MISELIPELQPFADDLIQAAARSRLHPRVTSTRRSHAEQKRLYEKFLRGESRFPVAPPGRSAHEYGWAFDMVVTPFEALSDVGAFWQGMGGVWGASDPIHFEYPGFSPEPFLGESSGDYGNIVQQAGEWYANLPWWATLPLPSSATVAKGTIAEASRGSVGARVLCSLGVSAFC